MAKAEMMFTAWRAYSEVLVSIFSFTNDFHSQMLNWLLIDGWELQCLNFET